jgi:Protein of unknown function (DUF4238)
MPRDHYLPASVIGRFSVDSTASARERVVFVLRKGRYIAFQAKAAKIGYVNDLYRVSRSPSWGGAQTTVDPNLNGYEPDLPRALDQLEQSAKIDIVTWLRVLVPYVASLFVRGHDFIGRFMSRPTLVAASDFNTVENANGARFLEFERLLAPVCCARWVVLHKESGERFVLNDLGLTGTVDMTTGESGWAVPIGPDSMLGIFPKQIRAVARYNAGGWWAIIEHRHLNGIEARGFNDAMARLATSYVVGSDRQIVERLAPLVGEHTDVNELMDSWPVDYRTRVAHARDWHRLITATADRRPPSGLDDLQKVDPDALAGGWCPPIGIALNMREFPTGLKLIGNLIWLALYTPANYQDYSIRPVDMQ